MVQKFCRTVTMIFDRFCKNNISKDVCLKGLGKSKSEQKTKPKKACTSKTEQTFTW